MKGGTLYIDLKGKTEGHIENIHQSILEANNKHVVLLNYGYYDDITDKTDMYNISLSAYGLDSSDNTIKGDIIFNGSMYIFEVYPNDNWEIVSTI